MSCTTKKLPQGLIEIACEVAVDDIKNDLSEAAKHLSEQKPIDGYRPGKAPYDVVKQRFGEMAVYEHALPAIVRRNYVKAVMENSLRTYGEPRIEISRLAPGNPIAFNATVAVVPAITSLADFRSVKVSPKPPNITEAQIDQALKDLQRMQTKEIRAAREVREHDKVVLDMDLSQSGVALEGGQARDHGVYLDEPYYVPGLKEQVLGLKEGDKKTFMLKFPETHFQKHIAGKEVDFAVTVKGVFELQHPPLDDAFAKTLGQESMAKIRQLVRENMEKEAQEKDRQRMELEVLEKLVDKSRFEDVPEIILNDEISRMIEELKRSVTERGVDFDDYLRNIKKTIDELKVEFMSQAVKRVKTAILIRDIGEKEKIDVSDVDVMKEVEGLMNAYSDNAKLQEQVRTEEYQDYIRTSLRNRKTVEMLRETATGEK